MAAKKSKGTTKRQPSKPKIIRAASGARPGMPGELQRFHAQIDRTLNGKALRRIKTASSDQLKQAIAAMNAVLASAPSDEPPRRKSRPRPGPVP